MPWACVHLCNHMFMMKIKKSDNTRTYTSAQFQLIQLIFHGGHSTCNLFLVPETIEETNDTQWDLFHKIFSPVWDTKWNMPLLVLVPRLCFTRSFLHLRCVHNTPRTVFRTFPLAQCPASILFVHHVVALSIVARVSFRNARKDHSCRDSDSCAITLTEIPPMTLFSSFHCFAIHAGALKSQGTSSHWWYGDPVPHTG